MKTARAVELAGGRAQLAGLLGLGRAAVHHWGEDIPEGRAWQLRVLRPEWFPQDAPGGGQPIASAPVGQVHQPPDADTPAAELTAAERKAREQQEKLARIIQLATEIVQEAVQ